MYHEQAIASTGHIAKHTQVHTRVHTLTHTHDTHTNPQPAGHCTPGSGLTCDATMGLKNWTETGTAGIASSSYVATYIDCPLIEWSYVMN